MSLTLDFIKRVAPNNAYPATHFIEIWRHKTADTRWYKWYKFDAFDCDPIQELEEVLADTANSFNYKTVAIFKIRENKTSTLYQFNQ